MSHFAKIEDNLVTQIIVAEQAFIDLGGAGNPSSWIQTSYNTYGNIHLLDGVPLRKNYAGIGYTYNSELDAFIPPKPIGEFVLNTVTGLWNEIK